MKLALNEELIKHPEVTFYARVRGHSMKDAGIQDGDLTLKRLAVEKVGIYLMSANDEFKPIKITDENDFLVWGVVAYVVPDRKPLFFENLTTPSRSKAVCF